MKHGKRLLIATDRYAPEHQMNPRKTRLVAMTQQLSTGRDTEQRAQLLITIKINVIDACFAGLDTMHYLLKVLVLDLQSIPD